MSLQSGCIASLFYKMHVLQKFFNQTIDSDYPSDISGLARTTWPRSWSACRSLKKKLAQLLQVKSGSPDTSFCRQFCPCRDFVVSAWKIALTGFGHWEHLFDKVLLSQINLSMQIFTKTWPPKALPFTLLLQLMAVPAAAVRAFLHRLQVLHKGRNCKSIQEHVKNYDYKEELL